ncbi:MAG TPA: OmpH family outer membrane protein [Allosphingosinicella sp.]|nr:OmpH family outer membrane protein [Allosphingosinicella sp.]
MNRLIFSTALCALALAAPVATQAQQLPPAVVAVVNRNQIATQCTACTAATQALQQQGQQYQAREQQLLGPLQTEQQAIQTAINAIPQGGQPDQALQTRARTWETNREAASQELGRAQQTIQRNQQHVVTQILQRMQPLIVQVTQQRGASVAMDSSDLLFAAPQIDITQAVLALMNQNAAPFQTVAPPPAAPAAPAPAAAQPNRPRPQGR